MITETLRTHARGYGYELTPTDRTDAVASKLPAAVLAKVDSVVDRFGGLGAAELELRSTVYYAAQEAARGGERLTDDALAARVHEVKPHFPTGKILDRITEMRAGGVLTTAPAA